MPNQNLGDLVERGGVENPAGRILRRIEYQQACLRRDLRFELRRIEREAPALAQIDRHRHRAVRDDLRFVNRKSRYRIDHFVARAVIGHRRDRIRDERFRSGCDDDVFGADIEAAVLTHVLRRRSAQFVDAR